MDVIVLLNHSLFKRRCLLEDHRILIFRVGIVSKAELSKTVGDIFVFILLNALQYMGMVADHQVGSLIDG